MNIIKLQPIYLSPIWSGERLKKIRNLDKATGISREVCCYKGLENRVLNPEYVNLTVGEILKKYPHEIMGNEFKSQLIRVAFMDAIQDLSLQVHPNSYYAQQIGDYEKSESWYILDASDNAFIYAGTTTDNFDILKKAIEENKLLDYMNKVPVRKGDFILIPAGMAHAFGKNIFGIEIGSFGGITYRLYDFGRGRELDIQNGLSVLNPRLQPTITKHPKLQKNGITTGVNHPLFHVDVLDVNGSYSLFTNDQYHILTCVEGSFKIRYNEKTDFIKYTETVLIPQCIKKYTLEGIGRSLVAYTNKVSS